MEFDIGKWFGRVQLEQVQYADLFTYIASKEHLASYVDSRTISSYDPESSSGLKYEKLKDLHIRDDVIESVTYSLESAMDTFSRQMIVLAVTFSEGIIQEYFECLFFKHPTRMHEFIAVGEKKGLVNFQEFLAAESKQDFLAKLSRSSASKALEGKFESALVRLQRLSKHKMNETLKNRLIDLAKLRNEIIHDAIQQQICKDQIKEAFKEVETLLDWLCAASEKNKIPLHDLSGHFVERIWTK